MIWEENPLFSETSIWKLWEFRPVSFNHQPWSQCYFNPTGLPHGPNFSIHGPMAQKSGGLKEQIVEKDMKPYKPAKNQK